MRSPNPSIRVDDLVMRYGTTEVLDGVSFTIDRGEVLVLLGPNGAGKTTTIEILEGFREPSAGTVAVLGVDPLHGDEAWRARIGVVLQSWRDHGRWRVRDLLEHLGSYYRPYGTAQRARPYPTDELIDTVGLREHAAQKISTLSGGQRRRLDVAIGIVGRPELLFLDEPTAGLRPGRAARVPRPRAPAVGPAGHHDPAHHPRPRRGGEARRPDPDPEHGRIVANGSADELAHQVAGTPRCAGRSRATGACTAHPTRPVSSASCSPHERAGESFVEDLEVQRPSLESIYLAMVAQQESDFPSRSLEVVT